MDRFLGWPALSSFPEDCPTCAGFHSSLVFGFVSKKDIPKSVFSWASGLFKRFLSLIESVSLMERIEIADGHSQ
jgi:hypothetical protein